MARDNGHYVRLALIAALKDLPELAAIAGDRVYPTKPPFEPVWPFVRYGVDSAKPFLASCLDGSIHDITIHAFHAARGDEGVRQMARIIAGLDAVDVSYTLAAPWPAILYSLRWQRSQIMTDPGGWHAVVEFEGRVSS
jgi:hypothetical protein